MSGVPRGLYGPGMDGLGDPERATVVDRQTTSPERLAEERKRRAALSPFTRALQAATDRAMKRR